MLSFILNLRQQIPNGYFGCCLAILKYFLISSLPPILLYECCIFFLLKLPAPPSLFIFSWRTSFFFSWKHRRNQKRTSTYFHHKATTVPAFVSMMNCPRTNLAWGQHIHLCLRPHSLSPVQGIRPCDCPFFLLNHQFASLYPINSQACYNYICPPKNKKDSNMPFQP